MKMWRWTSAWVGGVALGMGVTVSDAYSSPGLDWPAGQTGGVRVEAGQADRSAPRSTAFQRTFKPHRPTPEAPSSLAGLSQPSSNANLGCAGNSSANPDTVHYRWFAFTVPAGGALRGTLKLPGAPTLPGPAGTVNRRPLFVDLAAGLTGTVTCPTYRHTYEGTFASGWNLPHGATPSGMAGPQANTIQTAP